MAILPDRAGARHRLSLEGVRPEMAKADLRKVEVTREDIGRAIARARGIVGWTQDQLAGAIADVLQRDRFDPAQIARWEAAKERPQFDVLLAVEPLFWPLITELARLDGRAEIVTTIHRRRA